MELAQIIVEQHGPAAEHNMPCSICQKRHAVYDMNQDRFLPCWQCQKKGWRTVKLSARLRAFLKLMGVEL